MDKTSRQISPRADAHYTPQSVRDAHSARLRRLSAGVDFDRHEKFNIAIVALDEAITAGGHRRLMVYLVTHGSVSLGAATIDC